MKEKILIIIIGIIEALTIKSWLMCQEFKSMMNISSVNMRLQLEDYIHTDTETSLFIIRFFHNKVVTFVINVLDKYLKFWDIRFSVNVFSIVGIVGIAIGLWQLSKLKIHGVYKILLFAIFLLWPLPYSLNLVDIPFVFKLLAFVLPYYILSLFGIWKCLQNNKKYSFLVLILLSLLSVWWLLLLPKEIEYFCIK